MRKIAIYGHSDDLLEIEGDRLSGEPDEISAVSGRLSDAIYLKITDGDQGLIVSGEYGRVNGCWVLGVTMLEEDIPLPGWVRGITAKHGYSPALELELPESARIEQLVD